MDWTMRKRVIECQQLRSCDIQKLLPLFGGAFKKAPLYFPLCEGSEYYDLFANSSKAKLQQTLDSITSLNGAEWSVSGYLENRATILRDYQQMVTEGRYYHLGIDLNAPCGTKLYSPQDCEVAVSKYEEGEGNYGGVAILRCTSETNTYYMLFGHLNPKELPATGKKLSRGEAFAEFGNMSQNGNWFYHTHLQILTQKAFDEGWEHKGYCAEHEIATIDKYCPNPLLFV
jgi:hypothetical protein